MEFASRVDLRVFNSLAYMERMDEHRMTRIKNYPTWRYTRICFKTSHTIFNFHKMVESI